MDTWALPMWVSPFRHLRIGGYVPLPAAFRSLSRLSSALSAKASALCSFLLDLVCWTLGLSVPYSVKVQAFLLSVLVVISDWMSLICLSDGLLVKLATDT